MKYVKAYFGIVGIIILLSNGLVIPIVLGTLVSPWFGLLGALTVPWGIMGAWWLLRTEQGMKFLDMIFDAFDD